MKNVWIAGLFVAGLVAGWAIKPLPARPDAQPKPGPAPIDSPRGPDGTPWTGVVVSPRNLLYEAERKYEDEKAAKERAFASATDSAGRADHWRKERDRLIREMADLKASMAVERGLWQTMTVCRLCGPKCKCGIRCQCSETYWVATCEAAPKVWPPIPPSKD